MSEDADVIKAIRTAVPAVRGIVDWTNEEIWTEEDYNDVIAVTNGAKANVCVLSEAQATKKTVTYIQSRMKTVWVKQGDYSKVSALGIVTTGAYGIITSDYLQFKTDLGEFGKTGVSMVRTPLNIAHRGLCLDTYENSLTAFTQAYQQGATHIEIDVHVTKDNRLIIMHDDTLNRTCNYTGSSFISEMNLSEIRNYKIIKSYSGATIGSGVDIPTVEEIFDFVKDIDLNIVFEIKTIDTGNSAFSGNQARLTAIEQKEATIPYLINQKLIEYKNNGYDLYNKICFISFNAYQLNLVYQNMPGIPTAHLYEEALSSDGTNLRTGGLQYLAENNCGIDYSYTCRNGATINRANALVKYGYIPYYWTYQSQNDIETGFKTGCYGITNNKAQAIGGYAKYLTLSEEDLEDGKYLLVDDIDELLEEGLECSLISYAGNSTSVKTTVFASEIYNDNYADVIFKYTFNAGTGYSYTLYTGKTRVVLTSKYMSKDSINALLNKKVSAYSSEDKKKIKLVKGAYDMLDAEDKAQINISKAESILKELEKSGSGNKKTASCGSVSSGENLFGFCTLLITACGIVAVKKVKQY